MEAPSVNIERNALLSDSMAVEQNALGIACKPTMQAAEEQSQRRHLAGANVACRMRARGSRTNAGWGPDAIGQSSATV